MMQSRTSISGVFFAKIRWAVRNVGWVLTTSAGLVFVWRALSRAPWFAPVTPLKTFVTEPIMPPCKG